MRMLKDIASFVARHTAPSRAHLTPSVALSLLRRGSELWTERWEGGGEPFWAFYWPGGQAVARYILDNGKIAKDKRILDVGCGCGAGSIAAAMMGARRVVANDIDTNMFYDEEFAQKLFTWLHGLTENGKTVLIGDPGRHGLTASRQERLTLLAKYQLPPDVCAENHGLYETSVWRLDGNK